MGPGAINLTGTEVSAAPSQPGVVIPIPVGGITLQGPTGLALISDASGVFVSEAGAEGSSWPAGGGGGRVVFFSFLSGLVSIVVGPGENKHVTVNPFQEFFFTMIPMHPCMYECFAGTVYNNACTHLGHSL